MFQHMRFLQKLFDSQISPILILQGAFSLLRFTIVFRLLRSISIESSMKFDFARGTRLASIKSSRRVSVSKKLVLSSLFRISFAHEPFFLTSAWILATWRWSQILFVLFVLVHFRGRTAHSHVVFCWRAVPCVILMLTAFWRLLIKWRFSMKTASWFQIRLARSLVDNWQSLGISGFTSMTTVNPTS